ncbi:bifunctional diaminohydroxyphosphoribosylaminopyrimidine deaminase/5-amino-6-(5-phosphoribosylamino)uracil reductase RibD [Thalassobacillus sp. CUG 92003]|uniref:bifunctional diaminohydroxyphosphoribosylaminopyrimidine deaminase/5-amino-6-(5-phosphoribosylamino)uracil reductase RibD n=1 Tax=Thalassobacillus sp. CUG 92003 TaxID=2736641 RepID=UPI0015E6A700|nr:bifunctional diaminohydroxyphosphoribosylaminopyrimidine deaminase/5-amino-6-(5-phosphoribosylamino)uracil reductase RibD [Thalassobacillus sp. CUG 92003]
MERDEKYMQMAIDMAAETVGQTSPNPSVGAVIVNDDQIVGVGVHVKAGLPHAEINALQMADIMAEGGEMFVTLEPCSHYGQTPPCAKAIIDAGLRRVVIASDDPNPKVAGRGVKMLEDAGIEVRTQVLKEEADQYNRSFFHFITENEPYVLLKSAMTLDGKIATVSGESQWITGEPARRDGHLYRHRSDAILVGVNTVLHDDPTLTARLDIVGSHPIRVILDTHLKTPETSKVIQNEDAPTWIFTGEDVPRERASVFEAYAHVRVIPLNESAIDVQAVLQHLGEEKVTSLLIEGGGTVADAFVRAGKVHESVTYIAPKLLGGAEAKTPVSGRGIPKLADVYQLSFQSMEQLGDDIKIVSIQKEDV